MPDPEPTRPAPGVPRWVPGLLAAVGVGCTLAAVLASAVWDDTPPVDVGDTVLGLLYPLVAALVLRRQPGNPVGWLLMTSAVSGPYALAGQYAVHAVLGGHQHSLLTELATWVAAWGFVPYFVIVALVPLYFPDGRLPSPRWRPVATAMSVVVVTGVLAAMFRSSPLDVSPRLSNPFVLTDALWLKVLLLACSMTAFLLGGALGVVALVVRMRRERGEARTRLQWLVLGESVLVVCSVGSIVLDAGTLSTVVFAVGFTAVPVAVAVAVLRHGLFDVDVVVNRAVVFAVLTVGLLAVYGGVVAALGELTAGERRLAVAVVAVAALLAAAAWERVQRGVDRLLYGERRDPLAVATRVGTSLDLAAGPADALQALVDEVSRALRLPCVQVAPDDARVPAATSPCRGGDPGDPDELPLVALGRPVGTLRVWHRSPGERWRRPERAALDDVARRAAVLVWAAGLVVDLQASRERIVAGREEERRRLRHDLHDGVGPELAGMALQLERLHGRVAEDPAVAGLAGRLRDQMRRTVAAVRRAVDDLRPPALDELGLAGALREHVAAYRLAPVAVAAGDGAAGDGAAGDGAADERVTVESGALPPLRAAVEVAAYRIATEAVANAVRHAAASRCTVRLGVAGDDLLVEVADDGRGVAGDAVPGVGTTSMRERAAELGGSLEVLTAPGAGTTVRATLPLTAR